MTPMPKMDLTVAETNLLTRLAAHAIAEAQRRSPGEGFPVGVSLFAKARAALGAGEDLDLVKARLRLFGLSGRYLDSASPDEISELDDVIEARYQAGRSDGPA